MICLLVQYSQGAGDLGPPHGMCLTFQPDPDRRLSTQQCQQTNNVLAFIATTVEFETKYCLFFGFGFGHS